MAYSQYPLHPVEELPPGRMAKLLRIVTSYYAIALAIAVLFAWLFGWLADEVLEQEFTSVNTTVLLAIHAHRSNMLDQLAMLITNIGSPVGIVIIGTILTASLLLLKRHVDLGTLAVVLLGAGVFQLMFKLLFHQVRPRVFQPLVVENDFSFPSGHSLTSFALWGFFAWWIVSLDPRKTWRWVLAALGLIVSALVAMSRLYLGVHWPTDVLGGMFLAFAWIGVCVTGQRWLTRHARRERRKYQRKRYPKPRSELPA
jgi:undecaprenyl-diphosphatase